MGTVHRSAKGLPRALGHIDGGPMRAGKPIHHLIGIANGATQAASLQKYVSVVLDQGELNACVAFALCQAVAVESHVASSPVNPSRLAWYALARQEADPGATTLPDDGAVPELAIHAASLDGLVDYSRYDDMQDVTKTVPIDVIEAGMSAELTGAYAIQDATQGSPPDMIQGSIQECIAQNHPICFAMEVDQSYMDLEFTDANTFATPSNYYQCLTGPSLGGHYQCIVGYNQYGVLVVGSWGIGFGFGGYAWLNWDFIRTKCTDFYAVTCAPQQLL